MRLPHPGIYELDEITRLFLATLDYPCFPAVIAQTSPP